MTREAQRCERGQVARRREGHPRHEGQHAERGCAATNRSSATSWGGNVRSATREDRMDLRTLETFRVAAHTLSFTQAAAALGYVQSSVTAQIKTLEGSLGVPLFDRMGNRLQLTAPGKRLLVYAERLLALAQEARAAVADDRRAAGRDHGP